MSNLLSANFARLRKNKLFWVEMIAMFLFGACNVWQQHKMGVKFGTSPSLENSFFFYPLFMGIITAIFVTLFIGTEYSDGTIRNKLTIGHSRNAIYLGNLITNILAMLFVCVSYLASTLIVGVPLFGFFETDMATILLLSLGIFIVVIALCSVYTFLSMNCANKTTTAVIAVVCSFVFLFIAIYASSVLSLPDYGGNTLRNIFKFAYDFFPSCQAFQYMQMNTTNLIEKMMYALLITGITTFGGLIIFNRKSIK